MTAGLMAKVRCVWCPRCHGLLVEKPDVPVYRCGGCDAVLQAKNRKDVIHNVGSDLQNSDFARGRELDRSSEDNKHRISSGEENIPPSGESNMELKDDNNESESGDCSREELGCRNLSEHQMNARNNDESHAFHGGQPGFSNQVCSGVDNFSHHENGELSDRDLLEAEEASISSSHEATIPSSGECIIDPDHESEDGSCEQLIRRTLRERRKTGRNNDESHACHGEQPGFSNRDCSEKEFAHFENGNVAGRVPSEEENSISSHEMTIPCSDEKDQEASGDSSMEQLVHMSERQTNARSNDKSHSYDDEQPGCSTHHENGKLSEKDPPEAEEASISSREVMSIPFSGDCFLDSKDERENEESSSQRLLSLSLSEHQGNDNESRACHGERSENSHPPESEKACVPSHEVIIIPFSGESILDPNDENDQKGNEDGICEQLVHMSMNKCQKNVDNDSESHAHHVEQSGFSNGSANHVNDELSRAEPSEDEIIDEILLSGEESSEADDNKRMNSNSESSGIVHQIANSSVNTADTQVEARIPSKTPALLAERVKESDKTINHDLEHQRSVHNFGRMEVVSCEPSGELRGMFKSPTKSSLAYDGSVSSYDGMDDQVLVHRIPALKNIHRTANFLGPRREKSQMNNAMATDFKVPYEARSSQMNLSKEKHYATEYRRRNQDDLLRSDFSMQNRDWLEIERDQTDCLDSYENGSTSGSMFEEFHTPRSHSSASFVDHDQDKVRLLKMVYELQDQLERTCNLNGKASGRVPMESAEENPWTPIYYNQQIPQVESWHDSEYPRYKPAINYPRQHSLSRIASAGKATSQPQNSRFQAGIFPENRGCSMQLLPSEQWHNGRSRIVHTVEDSYGYYSSCQSSPQHYRKSENLSLRNHEMKYVREKDKVAKHHLRPMAGGAPFITCYYCLKLLQIPAEFLLLKRRINRLKCGQCSKLLEFSLQGRTHIVPHSPISAESPSSGIDGPDPVSSYSSFNPVRRDMGKDSVLKLFQNRYRNSDKRYQVGKFSSEIEKCSAMSNSPLHQLMGYSSPSQVIRGLETSGKSMLRKDEGL